MKKLKINLENCYGIKKLDYEFDFEKSNVYSIYAPNGTMKTSFLKGFLDYISLEERKPCDKINNIEGKIVLKDENNLDIDKEKIFPVESLNLDYKNDFSALLINSKYKKEFDAIYIGIEEQKKKLIRGLNFVSKEPQAGLEDTVMKDYGYTGGDFYEFLKNKKYIDFSKLNDYENVYYGVIFNKKAQDLLSNSEISQNINEYDRQYKEILKKYSCFYLGGFTIYQADNLLKSIKDTQYFNKTSNELKLNIPSSDGKIVDEKGFKDFIDKIKNEISTNKSLLNILSVISKGTAPVKEFQEHLEKEGYKFVMKLNNQGELKKIYGIIILNKMKKILTNLLNFITYELKN